MIIAEYQHGEVLRRSGAARGGAVTFHHRLRRYGAIPALQTQCLAVNLSDREAAPIVRAIPEDHGLQRSLG